jgi:hypothetical protein
MTRPPLTIALSAVLTAAIDGAGRRDLLATLHPDFGRAVTPQAPAEVPGLAPVITLPRVIPMPRRNPDHPEPPAPDPSSAA